MATTTVAAAPATRHPRRVSWDAAFDDAEAHEQRRLLAARPRAPPPPPLRVVFDLPGDRGGGAEDGLREEDGGLHRAASPANAPAYFVLDLTRGVREKSFARRPSRLRPFNGGSPGSTPRVRRKAPGLMSKFSKVFGRSKSFDRNKPTVFNVTVQHR